MWRIRDISARPRPAARRAALVILAIVAAAFLHAGATAKERVIASTADLTGDGFPNVIIAYQYHGPGEVRINSNGVASSVGEQGAETLVILRGRTPGDLFGASVAVLDDLNGNGYFDLIIGAPKAGEDERGEAYVFFGPFIAPDGHDLLELDADDADVLLFTTDCDVNFGMEVAPFYNVTEDGRAGVRVRSRAQQCDGTFHDVTWVYSVTPTRGYPDGGEMLFGVVTDPRRVLFWSRLGGDALGDHAVTVDDVRRIIAGYGQRGDTLTPFDGDLNGDGVVDIKDLELVLNNIGNHVMKVDWSSRSRSGAPALLDGVGPWPPLKYESCATARRDNTGSTP